MCLDQSLSIDEIASEMSINPGKKLHENDTSQTENTYFLWIQEICWLLDQMLKKRWTIILGNEISNYVVLSTPNKISFNFFPPYLVRRELK
jgi:hypothetical protein